MGTVNLPSAKFTETELTRPVAANAFRVLAIGMVGWFHIWQQTWQSAGSFTYLVRSGAAWVDGMIMLSAFCLFLPYANARAQGNPFSNIAPLDFYKKRAIRILPSYYVSILAAMVMTICWKGWQTLHWKDVAAHLTMTQALFPESYLYSNLNGATWTLSILVGFYLLFPLLAKAMVHAPIWTGAAMFALQAVWKWHIVPLYGTNDYTMRFNQMPAFASTLALGMWGALLFATVARSQWMQNWFCRTMCTVFGFGALWCVSRLLLQLNQAPEYQLWQLEYRTPLVFCMTMVLVLFSLGLPLPGVRVWSFLSMISYNFYLWHQMLVVWLKYAFHLPAWQGELPPNQMGDAAWSAKSNLFYWAAALAAAVLMTWLVEKPFVKIYKKHSKKHNNNGKTPAKVV